MKPAYYILIVLGIILIGLFFWQTRSSAVIGLEDITFDRPTEFQFNEGPEGTIDLDFQLGVKDILSFKGQIRIFKGFDDYFDQVRDPLEERARFKTKQGDDIFIRSYADVGGLLEDYLVLLRDPNGTRLALVMIRKFTYEEPPVLDIPPEERLAQHEQLDYLFATMARSVRFAD